MYAKLTRLPVGVSHAADLCSIHRFSSDGLCPAYGLFSDEFHVCIYVCASCITPNAFLEKASYLYNNRID